MKEKQSLEANIQKSIKGDDKVYIHALKIPGLSLADCIDATDNYCALEFSYGDRVRYERVQFGKSITWIFNKDDIEIGRFGLSPNKKSFSWKVIYTSNSRKQNLDDENGKLFYEIMDDLEGYYYEYFGIKNRPEIRPARSKFWKNIKPESLSQENLKKEIDPMDQRILDLLKNDLDLTDSQIGQKIGISRQNVNNRRRALKKAGYTVR